MTWTPGEPPPNTVCLLRDADGNIVLAEYRSSGYVYEYEPRPPWDWCWRSYFWGEADHIAHIVLETQPPNWRRAKPEWIQAWVDSGAVLPHFTS